MDGFKPRLNGTQALRIKLNAPEIIIQCIYRFLQLYARRLQRLKHGLELVVDVDQLRQLLLDRSDLRQDGSAVVFIQQLQRMLCAIDQRCRMRQAAVFVADFGPFAGTCGQLFQFADLPFKAFPLHQHILCVTLEFFALLGQRAPAAVRSGHSFHIILQAGMRIEQLPLRIGFHQRLMRMLAVYVDQ